MQVTAQRDTPGEMALRRELHRRGLRYRLHAALPGITRARPDIVFVGARVAVFIDGCFWHSCPEHATFPQANAGWWEAKLAANVERDRRHDAELESRGWKVARVWEHERPVEAADRVESAVRACRGHTEGVGRCLEPDDSSRATGQTAGKKLGCQRGSAGCE
jgi:DNA mismatch endonuclease, patch repair protein